MSFITHTQMLHGHDGSNLEIGEDPLPGGAPWLTIRHCAGLNRHVAQPPASKKSDPANV